MIALALLAPVVKRICTPIATRRSTGASRRIAAAFVASVLTVSSLSGCNQTRERSNEPVSVIDSAGVTIVVNRAPLWSADSGWRVDGTPIVSIGGADADTNQHWKRFEHVQRMSDGRLVIAVEGELRWFDSNGNYLQTSTRSGDGPGEFRGFGAVHRLAGDSLLVADRMGLRRAVYAPDGSLVREWRDETAKLRALGKWTECFSTTLADGSWISCQHDASIPLSATNRPDRFIKEGWTSPGPGLLRQLRRIHIASPDRDASYPLGIDAGIEQFGFDVGDMTQFVVHPFHARSVTVGGGDPLRVAIATNPQYRIEIWTVNGRLERIIERENGRRAPNDAELADVPAALARALPINDPALTAIMLDKVPTPDSLPAVIFMTFGSRGELLVMREGHQPSHTHSVYDVFQADGRWLGTLRIPGKVYVRELDGDVLTVARVNDDGVMLAEVYALRR